MLHARDVITITMSETQEQPFVTIQDVAARAGVSAMTVSRVTNSPGRVAKATRQRVEQAIEELGYVPNSLARGLLTTVRLRRALPQS